MGSVIAHMSMSLDGFIADRDDQVGPLFDWYNDGPVETPSASERLSFHTDPASAEILATMMGRAGALICGRRLFDLTGAPVMLDDPVVTPGRRVTHLAYRVIKD